MNSPRNRAAGYGPCVLACILIQALAGCSAHVSPPVPQSVSLPPPEAQPQPFTATAYSLYGTTASGSHAHTGIVAADPDVLPLGSRIRVRDAGRYSGVYVVKDTGRKVRGHHIDIFLRNHRTAKRFGKRTVRVEVLQSGLSAEHGASR